MDGGTLKVGRADMGASLSAQSFAILGPVCVSLLSPSISPILGRVLLYLQSGR